MTTTAKRHDHTAARWLLALVTAVTAVAGVLAPVSPVHAMRTSANFSISSDATVAAGGTSESTGYSLVSTLTAGPPLGVSASTGFNLQSGPIAALISSVVQPPDDFDGDEILDSVDNCPFIANPGQEDLDLDLIGDVCDDDRDGDQTPNGIDPEPENDAVGGDQDGDTVDSVVDTDDDNDGILDTQERFHFPGNPNAQFDPDNAVADADNDRTNNRDEIIAGSDPNNPDESPETEDYVQADVTGDWSLYGYQDDAETANSPWWRACDVSFDPSGIITGSACTDADGATPDLTGTLTVDAFGNLTLGGDWLLGIDEFDLHMDVQRTVGAGVLHSHDPGVLHVSRLEIGVKRSEGGYPQSDFQGSWQLFEFGDAIGADDSFWVRTEASVDALGNLTGEQFTDSAPLAGDETTGVVTLDPQGMLSLGGELGDFDTSAFARLDAGKTVAAGTANLTFPDPATERVIRLAIKQGTDYVPEDLVGVWQVYLADDATGGIQDPEVSHLVLDVQPGGAASIEFAEVDLAAVISDSVSVDASGRVTFDNDAQGVFAHHFLQLDAGKSVVGGVVNVTDEPGAPGYIPGLLLALKSLAQLPAMQYPPPGSTLEDTFATFTWLDNGTRVTAWQVYVGTSQGAADIALSPVLGANERLVPIASFPADGSTLYVRLWYLDGVWKFVDYTYTTATDENVTDLPEIFEPAPESKLPGDTTTFRWRTNGEPVTDWQVYVGTSLGAQDLLATDVLLVPVTALQLGGLPVDGSDIFVRLWFRIAGAWSSRDFRYELAGTAPTMVSPSPATPPTQLLDASQEFTWTANNNIVTEWQLLLGNAPGAQDIFASGPLGGGTLSVVAEGLPTDGREIFAQLLYRVGGVLKARSFTYQAVDFPSPEIFGPEPGVKLEATTAEFNWRTNGQPVQNWQVYAGTLPGRNDLFSGPVLPAGTLSLPVSGLPADGGTFHVRLWFLLNGVWEFEDYEYLATDPLPTPIIVGDVCPTFTTASFDFPLDPRGNTVQQYQLYVGTTLGGSNIFNSGSVAGNATSIPVTTLPTDGTPVNLRLWYQINGVFAFTDYIGCVTPSLDPPAVDSPAPGLGTVLGSSNVNFGWITNGNAVSNWQLYVGTSVGSSNIHSSPVLPGGTLGYVVPSIPASGATVHVRLWYRSAGVWKSRDFQYTAPPAPTLTGDACPGITSASQQFNWVTNDNTVQQWFFYVGTTVGGSNIFNSGAIPGATHNATVDTLPTDGRNVNVRLWYQINGSYAFKDYVCGTATLEPPFIASPEPPSGELGDPVPPLGSSNVAFTWNHNGNAVTGWQLYVGTQPGRNNIHSSPVLGGGITGYTVPTIPASSNPVFVRLWYLSSGAWKSVDYQYAASPAPALVGDPCPAITSATHQFEWNTNGHAVEEWYLYVGTTPGGSGIFNSGALPAGTTSANVTTLPTNGSIVNLRLWYRINGAYAFQDAECPTTSLDPPAISAPSPTPVTQILAGTAVEFTWTNNGNSVRDWFLYVGSTPGGSQYFNAGPIASGTTSRLVTGLPFDGSPVFVRLWYFVNGAYSFADYEYQATTTAAPVVTSPTPNTTLPTGAVNFQWGNNTLPVTGWYLYAGKTPGGSDYFNSGQLASGILSREVTTLPIDGSIVHVRLWYQIGGTWNFTDVSYTAPDMRPTLDSPTAEVPLGTSTNFQWSTNGNTVQNWYLYVGSSLGGSQYFNSGQLVGGTLSQTVTTLPDDGSNIFVRLWYRIAGVWQFRDVDYIALDNRPTITMPTPGGPTGASATFTWDANGKAVQNWFLYVGSTPGGTQFHNSGQLPAGTLSEMVNGLPATPVYVTLWYRIAGAWKSRSFSYNTF